jgi:hypothetical protein
MRRQHHWPVRLGKLGGQDDSQQGHKISPDAKIEQICPDLK